MLIDRWRLPKLIRVRSDLIVPDSANRAHTGLSVDHVHLIASSMLHHGFRARPAFGRAPIGPRGQPHDIPVLVQGGPSCPLAVQSLADMRDMCSGDPDFPHVSIESEQWYCSLGNGHFSQALNLFRQKATSKFTGMPFVVPRDDHALRHALTHGVPAIVLRADIPIELRRRVASLLNSTHEYKWAVDCAGVMDISPENCTMERFTQFEALSKVLDREALGKLVRLQLSTLSDGSIPAVGMRVEAIDASFYEYYKAGDVGVITRLTVSDPVVLWDHSHQERPADRCKLVSIQRRLMSRQGFETTVTETETVIKTATVTDNGTDTKMIKEAVGVALSKL